MMLIAYSKVGAKRDTARRMVDYCRVQRRHSQRLSRGIMALSIIGVLPARRRSATVLMVVLR
jgi:hypothetical protein